MSQERTIDTLNGVPVTCCRWLFVQICGVVLFFQLMQILSCHVDKYTDSIGISILYLYLTLEKATPA